MKGTSTSERAIIRPAVGTADMARAKELFLEYAGSLGFSLCFQGFDEELATLPGAYAPPGGTILLAERAERAVGVGALRPLGAGFCEMKRLYVRPAARGAAIGRRLADAIIAAAQKAGYRGMRLDTHESMAPAMALYRQLGFVPTAPYYDNPMSGVHYFERSLADASRP